MKVTEVLTHEGRKRLVKAMDRETRVLYQTCEKGFLFDSMFASDADVLRHCKSMEMDVVDILAKQ